MCRRYDSSYSLIFAEFADFRWFRQSLVYSPFPNLPMYILSTEKIDMNVNRIIIVFAWLKSRNHREIQIFFEFANFYKRFIEIFSRIVKAFIFLLKKENKRRFRQRFVFNANAKKTFEILKIAFIKVLILLHFDLNKRNQLETNAFDFVLSIIISLLMQSID
jgi:hypothetical protein